MINELIFMNGYGLYVWSAFFFTLISFGTLFFITKIQLTKEKKKFVTKFGLLSLENTRTAKAQSSNKEILSNTSKI